MIIIAHPYVNARKVLFQELFKPDPIIGIFNEKKTDCQYDYLVVSVKSGCNKYDVLEVGASGECTITYSQPDYTVFSQKSL
jgi:hypothetical protein